MSRFEGDPTDGQLEDPESLAETLLDAAAAGGFEHALADARVSIEARQDSLGPIEHFRYRMLFFDVAAVSTTDPQIRGEAAKALLAGAIEAGEPAWEAIRSSSRLDEIERLALDTGSDIELLELLAYAPDEGMRSFATSQIEAAGMRALDSGKDSRIHERLLHAIGASRDAYRLESARKQRMPDATGNHAVTPARASAPAYRLIAIAGGHAQLRGTAADLLQRHGVETVQIPSSLEAVRRERDIVQLLQGCDLAILLVRQITHSTSDQVRKAAEKLNVPVLFSNALSAVAIERQLFGSGE
jgi:hypothetical protein